MRLAQGHTKRIPINWIARVPRAGILQVRNRGGIVASPSEDPAQIINRAVMVRPDRERFAERPFRFVELAQVGVDHAQIVMCVGVLSKDRNRGLQRLCRSLGIARAMQRQAQAVVIVRDPRLEEQRAADCLHRKFVLATLMQCQAQKMPSIRMFGVGIQQLPINLGRRLQLPGMMIGNGPIEFLGHRVSRVPAVECRLASETRCPVRFQG